jgi:hypothetical protein
MVKRTRCERTDNNPGNAGFGRQKGNVNLYKGAELDMSFIPKVKIEVVVSELCRGKSYHHHPGKDKNRQDRRR